MLAKSCCGGRLSSTGSAALGRLHPMLPENSAWFAPKLPKVAPMPKSPQSRATSADRRRKGARQAAPGVTLRQLPCKLRLQFWCSGSRYAGPPARCPNPEDCLSAHSAEHLAKSGTKLRSMFATGPSLTGTAMASARNRPKRATFDLAAPGGSALWDALQSTPRAPRRRRSFEHPPEDGRPRFWPRLWRWGCLRGSRDGLALSSARSSHDRRGSGA